MPDKLRRIGKEYPPYLKEGDKVGIVSPAGACNPDIIRAACETIRSWGFRPIVGEHALGKDGTFSGTDEERAADLQKMLDDPGIAAILCSRGGYGTIRIMDRLDLTQFCKSPKWLIGFSDITALHARINAAGFASLHGSMARALANEQDNQETAKLLRQTLTGRMFEYFLPTAPHNRYGIAINEIVGGNLSLIYALQGTPYQLDVKEKILFIEDVSERLYQIDRMVQSLRLAGVFEQIDGLIVGQFSNIPEDDNFGKTLEEIILSAVGDRDIPVAFNIPVGHTGTNIPLIEGANASLYVAETKTEICERFPSFPDLER